MALLLSLSNSAHAENDLQTYVNHLKTFSADFVTNSDRMKPCLSGINRSAILS
jgi:outer membrane lipoprotein-sorting protein